MDEQEDYFRMKHAQAGWQGGTTTTVDICIKTANELVATWAGRTCGTPASPS